MKNENSSVNLIVLVEYSIQPSKIDDAIVGFTDLINEVKQEPGHILT